MFLTEPPPTQADLHFRVFGFPVRVHPFFWLTAVVFGLGGKDGTPPAALLIWVGVVFVSVLVHELGHAFAFRRYGGRPWITLHGIGGLASCDDFDDRPSNQIVIALAGPAAGFLVALLAVVLVRMSGRAIGWAPGETAPLPSVAKLPMLGGVLYWEPLGAYFANSILWYAFQVNILWGLVNLLPIYPLDGGLVAREICTLRSARAGIVLSLRISMVTAAAMAVLGLLAWQSLYTAIMFGYLAYSNYATLQAYQRPTW